MCNARYWGTLKELFTERKTGTLYSSHGYRKKRIARNHKVVVDFR